MQRRIRYYDDFEIGQKFESREYKVERFEIVEFARKYDPQSFHTGEAETANIAPLCKEVTCSGYHVASICMRLLVDSFLGDTACLTSPGLDYVKWLNPIMENDLVSVKFEVLEKRLSKSNSERGIIKVKEELFNQHQVKVFESVKTLFIAARGNT